MAGVTNRGKQLLLDWGIRRQNLVNNLYIALATNASAPNADTDKFGQLTEIAAGNGYVSGGIQLTPGVVDFDTMVEDDATDKSYVRVRDITWAAAGGSIPASGAGARWALLLADSVYLGIFGTAVQNREVIAYWDLTQDRSITTGQTLSLIDLEMSANET